MQNYFGDTRAFIKKSTGLKGQEPSLGIPINVDVAWRGVTTGVLPDEHMKLYAAPQWRAQK